jgi:hypothetical protein
LLLKVELGGWGEVWKALNLIDPEDGEMAEEEKQEGEEQEGEEQEGEEENAERCPTGNFAAHPAGLKLSTQYDVAYEDVMAWFCEGYGFGEIMLALQTSMIDEELTPEALLAMKTETGGWGQVWQSLGLIGAGKKVQPVDDGEGEGEENELNANPGQKGPPADKGKPAGVPSGPPADKGKPAGVPGGPPSNPGGKP